MNSRQQLTFDGFGLRFLFEGRIVEVSAPDLDTGVDSSSKTIPQKAAPGNSNEVLCSWRSRVSECDVCWKDASLKCQLQILLPGLLPCQSLDHRWRHRDSERGSPQLTFEGFGVGFVGRTDCRSASPGLSGANCVWVPGEGVKAQEKGSLSDSFFLLALRERCEGTREGTLSDPFLSFHRRHQGIRAM